jgi:glycosidase
MKHITKISITIIFTITLLTAVGCSAVSQLKESKVKHPEWSYNQTIYEVNVRQYSAEGTFKAFEKDLPRLKEMGIGIVWLMPIHPIGELNRKGTLGSQYSVKDFLAINPEFGTEADFRSLVNRTHELGMYLIIDWVANHCAWDNKLLVEHPDWFTKNAEGKFIPPVDDWTDVVDFNYDNKKLWRYMTDALKFWVQEYNIDGFRCDVAGMVPTEFWNQARAELDQIKPVFMLAEWETPEMHEEAFDMTYSWDLYKIFNSIAKKEKNVEDVVKYFAVEKSLYPKNAFRMRFTSNHDENTWNGTEFERLGDAVETFAVLTTVIPGMPLIYNGQEAAMNKRLKFFEKDPIDWKEHKFAGIYSKLFNWKMQSSVLQNGERGAELEIINSSDTENILAFVRRNDEEKILAVFNLSDKAQSFALNDKLIKGIYRNFFSGEETTFNEKESIMLDDWGYKIFIRK